MLPQPAYRPSSELVEEFMTIFGQPVLQTPTFDIDSDTKALRYALTDEEIDELWDNGYSKSNLIEVVDALADIVYVNEGAALSHGIRLQPTKFPPVFLGGLRWHDDEKNKRIHREFQEVNKRIHLSTSVEGLARHYQFLNDLCYHTAWGHGVDLDEVLLEVHASNLSKLGANGEVLRGPNGKVMKNLDTFFTPDLGAVLVRQATRRNPAPIVTLTK